MPGYQVKFESVLIGDTRYPIRSLLDGNQYHDPDGAAAAAGIPEAAWPLFGLVWPSARIMADAMLSKTIRGKRILEVGCGLGLASLVLQQRGGDITASDCHPLTDSFLQHNAQRCGLPAVPYQNGNWGTANPALGKLVAMREELRQLWTRTNVSAEQLVADLMAQAVIDRLEPVHVEQCQRRRLANFLMAQQQLFHLVLPVAAVFSRRAVVIIAPIGAIVMICATLMMPG